MGTAAIEIRIRADDWNGAVSGEGHVRWGLLRPGNGDLGRRVGEGGFVVYISLSRRGSWEVEEAGQGRWVT